MHEALQYFRKCGASSNAVARGGGGGRGGGGRRASSARRAGPPPPPPPPTATPLHSFQKDPGSLDYEDWGLFFIFSAVSEAAEEGIDRMPKFIKKLEDVVVSSVGESASFTCMVTGKPQPEVQWNFNGRPLPKDLLPGMHIFVSGNKVLLDT